MPDAGSDGADQMGGNPLQEGMLGGWKNREVRDESFASSARISLFETPEFATEQIIAPPDLFRHGLETEAAHRAGIQIPKGITDNLHASLGNLGAWVENPYENGELRPYYNKYWQVIRPSFMKPGALQIGVADPTMAEIINHVAQTDDLTPLYEYRGKTAHTKIAGPELLPFLPAAAEAIAPAAEAGAADAAGYLGTGAAGDAAGAAAADVAGESASGVGGLMKKVLNPGTITKGVGQGGGFEVGKGIAAPIVNYADDFLGLGAGSGGPGGGNGGMPVQDTSFYARTANDEDDLHPDSHDEIPKNEDGDHKQQADGNNHEWQRDISVNGVGGTDHVPSFDHGGPGFERLMMMAPLLLQYLQSGEDASQDPLIQGLHHSLESEVPGYLDHADDGAAEHLIMVLSPKDKVSEPEKNEPTHTDENSGGKHESRTASLNGDGTDFLPDLIVTPPSLNGFTKGPTKIADTQGPHTPEQIKAVQEWLLQHGSEHGLEGDELIQTILSVPTNPLEFADVLAQIQHSEPPPPPPEDAGMSANPPQPAQEAAPPGATMPVPGMTQQMLGAVERYQRVSADSVAGKCPNCESHTTELIGESGKSHCHGCGEIFNTDGIEHDTVNSTTSSWNVDDLRKEAEVGAGSDLGSDTDPVQGVPIADQTKQRDLREEQDSGHTWLDEDGNPLTVGQEYEMFSEKYDIPDLVRVEAVKPDSIVYTLTGEFGLEHSTELTKQEANIERVSFRSTVQDGEVDSDPSLEYNNDDNTGYTGTPEHRDVSAPSGVVSASVVESGVTNENPKLSWLMKGVQRTSGANYTPVEQRALIDEMGTARNSGDMNLLGTHYLQDADDDQFLFGY